MSNQLIPFNFEATEVRTIKDDQGCPWFVAKDVCSILGLTTDQTRRLDNDEKGLRQIQTLGGYQEMVVLTIDGVYELIFRSDKPKAKEFRRWLKKEVLPALARNGSYSISQEIPVIDIAPEPEPIQALTVIHPPDPEIYIKANSKQIKENVRDLKAIAKDLLGFTGNQLILSVNTAIRKIHKVDLLQVLNNQTNAPQHLVSDAKAPHFAVKDLADRFHISSIRFNQLLLQQGFQIETRNNKNKIVWVATDKGNPHCEMTDVSRLHSDGTSQQLRWYESILEVLEIPSDDPSARTKPKPKPKKLMPLDPQETFLAN